MKLTKKIARTFIFPALTSIGADKFLLSRSKKKCLILNFHGVTSVKGNRFNNRHLDVAEFEKLLVYLSGNFNVVSLKELFHIKNTNTIPRKKTVAITFDDGYLNNFTVALPLLKKYNIPATFYIITKSLAEKDYYVWPDLIDLVQREAREDIKLGENVFAYPGFYCQEIKKSLVDFLKTSGKQRDGYVNELTVKYSQWRNEIAKNPELIELVRAEQFKNWSAEPLIEYGSHTHAHYNLEFLEEKHCRHELHESKKILDQLTISDTISLAFPDGSYSQQTLDIAFSCGYKNLVAVDYKFGENNKVEGLLSRFTISNSTTAESNIIRLAQQFDKYGF